MAAERFQQLRERSRELFADLQALPQAGRDQWKPLFARAFKVTDHHDQ